MISNVVIVSYYVRVFQSAEESQNSVFLFAPSDHRGVFACLGTVGCWLACGHLNFFSDFKNSPDFKNSKKQNVFQAILGNFDV